ncbi:MAG: lipocalin-like domain-containing protein [Parachlamydiales bacterium]|nr:lipocalin-like domain-containing protein [Parachlamydiales bacterium]
MQNDLILGTWSLIDYTIAFEETQEVIHPYGNDPMGYITYTPSFVSVHIMRSKRDKKETLVEEKIEAAENYGGYVGTYELKENQIIHYPIVCGFVNFINVPQVRHYKLAGDMLTIECEAFNKERNKHGVSRLVWKRINQ